MRQIKIYLNKSQQQYFVDAHELSPRFPWKVTLNRIVKTVLEKEDRS